MTEPTNAELADDLLEIAEHRAFSSGLDDDERQIIRLAAARLTQPVGEETPNELQTLRDYLAINSSRTEIAEQKMVEFKQELDQLRATNIELTIANKEFREITEFNVKWGESQIKPSPWDVGRNHNRARVALGLAPLDLLDATKSMVEREAQPVKSVDPTLHASTSPGPINCSIWKRFQNQAYPRTCKRCGLGPCPFFNNAGAALHAAAREGE